MSSEASRDRVQSALDTIDARIAELSSAPEIVRDTAWELSLRSSEASAELAALKVQRSVWTLLGQIADETVADDVDGALPSTSSHRTLLDEIVRRSPVLQRAQSVMLWSEEGHRQQYRDEHLSVAMDWGTPYSQTLAKADPEDQLHPDTASQLHPDDARAETRFWRGVWQLIAGGLLAQADPDLQLPSAMQLCQAFGHDWRAVSLAGALPYHVAGDDVEGNWNRWLWRYTCRQAATMSPSASIWEKAVYALMAGDVQKVYPVCETWQEFVWVTCACWAVLAQDLDLYVHLRQTLDPRTSLPLDDEEFVARPVPAKVQDLVRWAESAWAEARPGARKDSYHRVMKYLMLDELQQVYDELYTAMTEPESGTNRIYHRPTYIEFAFRLYTALNPNPDQDEYNARIAVEFIRYLSTTHDLQHLIPEAATALPDSIKVEEYAVVLRACTTGPTRTWFLDQAKARFSPDIVQSINQRLLTLITPASVPISDDNNIEMATDNIDDLVSCQALDPVTAVYQANAFFREFIGGDQFDSALRLYREFKRPPPSEDYTDDQRELLCWFALVKARTKISDLERFLMKRPPTKTPETVEDRLDELQFGSAGEQLQTWEETRDNFFSIARRAVLAVVQFKNGWLRFDDADRDRSLATYRRTCLPDLVTRMFAVCDAMEARHMATCLDVVIAIADDGARAYEAFDAGRLQSLMNASRHVYLRYISAMA